MTRFVVPLGGVIAILALLGLGLSKNPRLIPPPLLGKGLPAFTLPTVRHPDQRLGSADLSGRVSLLNVWATWCVACRREHAMLLEIAHSGEVDIYGLNYKDTRPNAMRWLDQLGDPYIASAYDADGRAGTALGVYGAPETYLLARDGRIVHKHAGPISTQVWRQTLLPLIHKLRAGEG